jgi:hypothetical protein
MIVYLERESACLPENPELTLILALLSEISHELWFLNWLSELLMATFHERQPSSPRRTWVVL